MHASINKKSILSKPLDAYVSHYGEEKTEITFRLKQLETELKTLKDQQKTQQLDAKITSRKIGEARRNGDDTNSLKQSMQNIGKQQKQLSLQVQTIEQQILDFFEDANLVSTTTVTDKQNKQSQKTHPCRSYRLTGIDVSKISIAQLNEKTEAWNTYVDNNPSACIHHLSQWNTILKKSYNHECFYLYARDETNRIVGVLPLVRLKSRLFGDLIVSMPFFQRGGAIADHPQIEKMLIQAANDKAQLLAVQHIEYRDDIKHSTMPSQSHKVNMVLTLPDSKQQLWKSFNAKLRSQIKRPQREDLQVSFGHSEQLDDFYSVYARNMRDLGSPLHSKSFINNILQAFPDHSWLVTIKHKGKPVSAGFLLAYKETMEIPLASTIKNVNHMSVNMLLYWEILQFAINKNYRHFDFGRSSKNAGTYRFKKQWGARAKPLYWHYWLNTDNNTDATLPELNPSNPKFAVVIFLWKKLPVKLSQWIGPHIVKNIP